MRAGSQPSTPAGGSYISGWGPGGISGSSSSIGNSGNGGDGGGGNAGDNSRIDIPAHSPAEISPRKPNSSQQWPAASSSQQPQHQPAAFSGSKQQHSSGQHQLAAAGSSQQQSQQQPAAASSNSRKQQWLVGTGSGHSPSPLTARFSAPGHRSHLEKRLPYIVVLSIQSSPALYQLLTNTVGSHFLFLYRM